MGYWCGDIAKGWKTTTRKQTQNRQLQIAPACCDKGTWQKDNPFHGRSSLLSVSGWQLEHSTRMGKSQQGSVYQNGGTGKPRVVAHTGTIDSCWNQLKRFLPSALHSRHAMLFTYCKAWQWRFVHRNENVANITAQTLRKLTWCQKAPCGESSCPKQIWKSKKTIFCPQLEWDLQKIIVLPQRNLRFVLPQPWIFVTDFEGVFRMKMCSRWGKTLICVIPTVTALMDHAILQVRHWKTQHFYAYHTIEDVPKTLKRCPGFRALRKFWFPLFGGFKKNPPVPTRRPSYLDSTPSRTRIPPNMASAWPWDHNNDVNVWWRMWRNFWKRCRCRFFGAKKNPKK